ncbi:alpha-xenorhabdolysin family binary toxin subunit B [Pseudomonas syringae]|uniref:alpha-xenorhabdolysin family binary toxin subunit B n=2 Tax=Pseudomonas syringae TaxID=317 RepID=UPI0004159599|nr:alpha-xenorhabdolysin family binary toxin subunit B [Pseudomonas syringae]MCF5467888.1 alpha-xenorhabdolysin family binary toxin subunit B [Pseudomonas syringae]MCF5474462.1 alpha-xenorhabdolysin family binary toxin subunit B [Pseudomonas syringae]MCF5484616.1 alpha-xenorhabdolysin family binary toxin subunit B [Pseudomonas syringae]MCF5489645.1 alpha-xenorhabdolysin family binary toxin subunit B [Pseudomonas syringae]MCF5492984.1 alpha-xenorhabdolysin family binary toxin subunit B [Pseudom
MNVHVLDTPFQLPKPDIAIIATSREKLKQTADTLGDIYLPVIKETLRSMVSEVGNVDKQVLDTLTLVPHMLSTEEMLPFLEAVKNLRSQPDNAKSSAAIADFNEEISTLLDARMASLSNQAKMLSKALINLDAIKVDTADHLIPDLDQNVVALEARLVIEQERLNELSQQIATVNALVKDIESLSLFDKLKPLVASLQVLAEVDPKNPLIGSIKAGITGVSNILNLVDAAVDYEQLIGLREMQQTQLTGLQATVDETRTALKVEVGKRDQLSALAPAEVCKKDYVREMGKLLEALKHVEVNSRLPATEVIEKRVEHFRLHADALNNYLVDLRSNWRN